jgi:hypothetical protein
MPDEITGTRSNSMANSAEELNSILDQARDAMVANGMDRNTAEAILFGARPAIVDIRGNYADLQRSNAKEVVVTADAATVTGEGEILTAGQVMGEVLTEPQHPARPLSTATPSGGSVTESSTKAELLAEAERRGVDADDSMTKADIWAKLNA